MKIGLMHNLYGEFRRGGAETVVKMMVEELRADGQEVFLITTKPRRATVLAETGNDGKNQKEKIYYVNSEFYNLGKHSSLYRVIWQISHFCSFNKYRRIKKILLAEKPDLVITHNLLGLGWLTPLAIRKLKIRHEHFLHDIQLLHPSGLMIFGQENKINNPATKIYQSLTRTLLGSPTKVISPSTWLFNLHRQKGFFLKSQTEIRSLRIKETGTDIRQKREENDFARNFLFVGQVEDHKGIFLLISVFKKISDPKIKLRIAGDGKKLTEAKKMAGADKRIEFLGRLDAIAIRKEMMASDLLVVPSLCYENSPTVIYEAQSSGLPVIAADLGGIPEILGPHDKLFLPSDEEDLRLKIIGTSN